MSYSYAWHGASRTPSKAKPNTPSRSSRRTGFTNLTHYNAYTRSDGVTFSVGDAVEVWEGAEFMPAQVWLDPVKSYSSSKSRTGAAVGRKGKKASTSKAVFSSKGKGRSTYHSDDEESRSDEEEWKLDDGLGDHVKFAIIIDLFEDETESMRVILHWLSRPRLLCFLFGPRGVYEEGLDESLPKELIYTFDPTCNSLTSKISNASRAEDTHDVTYILSHIRLVTYEQYIKEGDQEQADRDPEDAPTYFLRKALNTKAESGDGWFYDINWQDVYEKGCASGNWELKMGGAEPEPPKQKAKKAQSRKTKDKATAKGKKAGKTASVKAEGQAEEGASRLTSPGEDSEPSSSSEEEDEEEEYNVANTGGGSSDEEEPEGLSSSEDEAVASESDFENDDVFGSRSASAKKRKAGGASAKDTPVKRHKAAHLTGNTGTPVLIRPSAATLRKAQARAERQAQRMAERQARRLKPRLPGERQANGGLDHLSPFERARAVLHVGATPDYLPCRDEEYAEIEAYLEDAIDEGMGSCIYIAGVPGTGKTATVRSVMSALQRRSENKEINSFRYLEVNGMKITDPAQSFSILWEFLSGARASPKQALAALETHFKTPSPGRDTCVILVDELDQLVTKKQEVIYNFFNWPNQPHSRLIVIAVANTMDLPERELSNKINSRLGSNRINFTPYDKNQLIEILTTRIQGLDGVFGKDAIGLVAGKVAGVTGDARRALDICRRAVEKVEAENAATGKTRMVTAADIVVIHKEMTSSGLLLFVKRAGLHQRIMLLALSRAIRKVGVADEVEFGDVIRWHVDFCRQTALNPLPTHAQLFSVLQSLADMKLVLTEGARLDYFQRVQAAVSDEELELVLRKEQRFIHYLR